MQLVKFLSRVSVWLGSMLMAGQVMATDLPLSDMPLALRTQSALPNVLFLLDDSGSMAYQEVFYSPGYDSDYEYRCISSAPLLASDNSKTMKIYVSNRNGFKGIPYFTYGATTYGWGTSGSADGAAGTTASRTCFDPMSEYVVKFRDYTDKRSCSSGYDLTTVSGNDICRKTETATKNYCDTAYYIKNTYTTSDKNCYLLADRVNRTSTNCTSGYTRILSTSTNGCGKNSSRVPWSCPVGYTESGSSCVKYTDIAVLTPYLEPRNAGNDLPCETGYQLGLTASTEKTCWKTSDLKNKSTGSTPCPNSGSESYTLIRTDTSTSACGKDSTNLPISTRVVTGNFLNWYLSATESKISASTLLPGYKSYSPNSPWSALATADDPAGVPWTQQPASDFSVASSSTRTYGSGVFNTETATVSDPGMKPNVSFYWDKMAVAKDVSRLLIRKIFDVNFALASFHTNPSGSKPNSEKDDGWLMHALVSYENKLDDPTTTDDDAQVAAVKLATENNKKSTITMLKKIYEGGGTPTAGSMVRMARYMLQGYESENFRYYNKVDAATPPAVQVTPRITTTLKVSDVLNLPTRATGATGYSSTTKNLSQAAWCQKTAMAVLTDGQPSGDTGYAGTGPLATYDTVGTTYEDYSGDSDYKGIIRVPGALYDHDWIPSIRGQQNIETFFIAFGSDSVINDDVFKHAGNAGGGGSPNSFPASDGGAVVEAFKKIIQQVTADSLSITAIAVSSVSELKTENYAFQATYDTQFFTSDLKSLRVNEQGQFVQPDGSGASRISTGITPVWNTLTMMNRMYAMNDGALTGVTPAPNSNYRDVRDRLIYTWTGATGMRFGSFTMARPGSAGTSFTEFTSLPLKIRNDLSAWAGANNQERYDLMLYLMGDPKNELYYPTADTLDNEKFRQRGSFVDKDGDTLVDAVTQGGLLGDIVNSSPQYQKVPSAQWNDIHYGTSTQKFSRFKELHADRPAVVYVGGNDGMLHAVTVAGDKKVVGAKTLNIPAGGELFAYMPSIVASSNANEGLHNLADPYYKHKFMVDLTPTISDVFVDFYVSGAANPEWRSVLVGGLGKGGRGYYALDVTCPTKDTSTHTPKGETVAVQNTCANEEFGPNNVLWEFSDADDADMGYSFSEPIIAKINYDSGISNDPNSDHGGRWAVITGNGYNSKFGRAALYILFLDGGRDGTWTEGVDYLKLYISSVDDSVASKNGLSSPTAIDINYDGLIDRVYAGDLKGQMWSFDISAAADAGDYASTMPWSVNKLFTTGVDSSTPQPITTAPAVSRDNSYGRIFPTTAPDLMVIFGTGRYLTELDIYDESLQTLYAVHDRGVYNLTRYDSVLVNSVYDTVLEPRFFKEVDLTGPGGISKNRTIEGDPIKSGQYGWYVDLASDLDDNDMITGSEIKGERLVFRPIVIGPLFINKSIIPNPGSCAGATQSWTTIIDWTTGGAYKEATYDANLDGVINATDLYYVSQFNESGGSALGRGGSNLFDSVGADARSTSYNFGNVTLSQRIGWEEILPFGIRGE